MKMECSRRSGLFVLAGAFAPFAARAKTMRLIETRERFDFLNEAHWIDGEVEGRACLVLDTPGKQRPPVRRPGEFTLLKGDAPIGDFTVEAATLRSPEVINRDVCLIFGYHGDTRFYYAHVSSNSDNKVHNVIMRVDGDRRERINLEVDPEPRLNDGWRMIRVRHESDGNIAVFVDDMNEPVMTARDDAHAIGRVGFGTFDDRAAFATLTLN